MELMEKRDYYNGLRYTGKNSNNLDLIYYSKLLQSHQASGEQHS